MSNKNDKETPKKRSVVIQFRTGSTVKTKIDELAESENLKPVDIARKALNAGLEHLYGLEIKNNELVTKQQSSAS